MAVITRKTGSLFGENDWDRAVLMPAREYFAYDRMGNFCVQSNLVAIMRLPMQRQYFLADDSRRSSVISAIGRLGLPVLLLLFVALAEVHGDQSVVEPPMDQLLHERDTQFGRLSELLQQGNQAAAIPTAEEVARIDRLLLARVERDAPNDREVHAMASRRLENVLSWLAERYEERADLDRASSIRKDLLELKQKALGAEHWQVIDARLALAHIEQLSTMTPAQLQQLAEAANADQQHLQLSQQGRYSDAIPFAQKAADIYRKVLGEEHSPYANSVNNLALLYHRMGDLVHAEPLYRQALELRKETLGEKHPSYATSLNNLGALLEAQKDFEGAEPLMRQALAIRKEVLGEKSAAYIGSLNNLAWLYQSEGDYARAEPLSEKTRQLLKEVLGEKHPDYAVSLTNLATLYLSMGDYARAEPLYLQALKIRKEVLGATHPEYAVSLNNLAVLYRDVGDYARAEPLFRQSQEILKQVLGEKHPRYATGLSNQAMLYESMGDFVRAESLLLQALEIRREVLGEKHPDYAASLNMLAVLLHTVGDDARAKSLCQQALKINKESLGEKHPVYAANLNNLAAIYDAMGDHVLAEPLYLQALETRRQMLGEAHPDFADSLNNLAWLYCNMSDFARAEPLYLQALQINKRVLGEQHPKYAVSLNNLATLYDAMGDCGRAEPLYRQGLAISRHSLEDSSLVQSQRQQLAMTLSVRHQLDSLVSLAVRTKQFHTETFREVLAWKGATLVRQRQMRKVANEEAISPLFAQLRQTVTRLATLSPSRPRTETTSGVETANHGLDRQKGTTRSRTESPKCRVSSGDETSHPRRCAECPALQYRADRFPHHPIRLTRGRGRQMRRTHDLPSVSCLRPGTQ